MTKLDAEQKARAASNSELSAELLRFADDGEVQGQNYAFVFMREAARRLELLPPDDTSPNIKIAQCPGCGGIGGHVKPCARG